MSRPEHKAPPEIFYNDAEAAKYTTSSRIQTIQAEMAERCLELLNLPVDPSAGGPRPSLLLDIGCGSGLSGEILSEQGHEWVGVDVSGSMLEIALEREVEGDLCLQDIGQGFGFRPGSFDGAISVSVIQWLCNADASTHSPPQRLKTFFETLFASLTRGARAVFQFYPESDDQVRFIMNYATKAGFGGGLVVDYPNSNKSKKFYLVLMSGVTAGTKVPMPQALGTEHNGQVVRDSARQRSSSHRSAKGGKNAGRESTKEFIRRKKELYRARGKEGVPRDSAYTGRRRRLQF